ncbi:MAG TPA: ABC transporter permease [Chloroflexota bacterium]|nr:ABC transporter permease [Chloroflexota bacterium]
MAQDRLPSRSLSHSEAEIELGAAEPLAADEADSFASTQISSPTRDAWRRFRRNKAAIIGLTVIVLMMIMAVFAPFMHTSDPTVPDPNVINGGPSPIHWFGTDYVGRDGYSRIVYGLRVPLIVGFIGTAITVIIGTLVGLIAGYVGRTIDSLLSRFTDIMFAFPGFILALIVVSLFGAAADSFGMGGAGRVLLLTVVFAAVGWPPLMRFVRSLALTMKEQQFVEAARTAGSRDWGIMRRHLLPNMWGLVLVQGAFIVVATISNETILSIFGLTVQQPNPDLGSMLFFGVQNIDNSYWQVVFPGVVLAILILALTFLADGIRDAVDPRARG